MGILIFMSHLLGLQFVRQLYGRFSRALFSLVAFVFTGSCENHFVPRNSALNPKARNTILFYSFLARPHQFATFVSEVFEHALSAGELHFVRFFRTTWMFGCVFDDFEGCVRN